MQRSTTGLWFTFFAVHGLLVVAEAALQSAAKRVAVAAAAAGAAVDPLRPHPPLSGVVRHSAAALQWGLKAGGAFVVCPPPWATQLLTLVVLEVTASLWFFDVLLEPGIVTRTLASLRWPWWGLLA